jgi:arylsulfatase A-like enzyme
MYSSGLALALALLVLAGGTPGCAQEPALARAQNLFLITADTWRGDHLLGERAGQPLTPELDAFSSRSLRFTTASSVSTETSPGVAGILTGLFPHRAGVIYNLHILPATVPTLASVLRKAGFATAAWVANPVIRSDFGFGRGFGDFEFLHRRPPQHKARAEELSRRAREWLQEQSGEQRVFAWLHYMDPHGPYEPPAEQRALFPVEAFDAQPKIALLPEGNDTGHGGIPYYQRHGEPDASRDGRDYLARYAAEVRYLDGEIGRFLSHLDAQGWLENSIVVVTSDHGEALAGDHGYYFSHGNDLTQDQIHVPLLLYYPGCRGGQALTHPVSTVDIVPTVMSLLDLPALADVDGASLLSAEERPLMSETLYEVSVREGAWKLRQRKESGALRLVNLDTDPAEASNRLDREAERARTLERRLQDLQSRKKLGTPISRVDLSEDHRKELEALGYLAE